MKKKILLLLLMVGPFVTGSVADAQGGSRSSSVKSGNVQPKEEAKPIKPVNQADTTAQSETHRKVLISSTIDHPKGKDMDIIDNDTIYILTETAAEFPGGKKKLSEYLHSDLRYPEEAMLSVIQGIYVWSLSCERMGPSMGLR